MSPTSGATRTYRGSSLEELLPRIRAELGEDAVITRQREGIVGGIGGFFGKRVLEVEATAAAFVDDLVQPAVPAGHAVSAYLQQSEEPTLAEMADNPVVARLIDQSRPFAAHLSALLDEAGEEGSGREERSRATKPAERAEGEPRAIRFIEVDEQTALEALDAHLPIQLPSSEEAARSAPIARPEDDRQDEDGLELRELGALDALEAAGLRRGFALSLVREALLHARALTPDAPFTGHLRRTIARRIPVGYSFTTPGHRLALVGPPEGGKTSVAARLARGYAGAGLRVAVLSLESERAAEKIRRSLRRAEVDVHGVSTVRAAGAAAARLADGHDLVIIDTPSVSAGGLQEAGEHIRLVGAAAPDVVHLVAPAPYPNAGRALAEALEAILPVDRLLLTHVDATSAPGALIELAIERQLAVSYVSSGDGDGSLAPADPVDLARLLLA